MTRSVLPFRKARAKEEYLEGISLRVERRETVKQTMPQAVASVSRSGRRCRKRHVPFRHASACDALPGAKTDAIIVKFIF